MKKKIPLRDSLIMLQYLAWWKICDIEQFLRKVLTKEGMKEMTIRLITSEWWIRTFYENEKRI